MAMFRIGPAAQGWVLERKEGYQSNDAWRVVATHGEANGAADHLAYANGEITRDEWFKLNRNRHIERMKTFRTTHVQTKRGTWIENERLDHA